MSMHVLLSDAELDTALTERPLWSASADRRRIARTITFPDFSAAFGFMARVALAAERMDHHPDWRNVWNRVEIALATHDAGGVTSRDLALADAIDALASSTLDELPTI